MLELYVVISALLITVLLSFLVYVAASDNLPNIREQRIKQPYSIFFIDYFLSAIFKSKGNLQLRRTEIIKANLYNLLLSSLLLMAAIMIPKGQSVDFNLFILLIFLFRAIGRTIEMILSITSDLFLEEVTSSLTRNESLKLAFRGYVELFVLFSSLYYLIDTMLIHGQIFNHDILQAMKFTVSVQTYTLLFERIKGFPVVSSILVYLQLFAATILVIVAITKYIGVRENMINKETEELGMSRHNENKWPWIIGSGTLIMGLFSLNFLVLSNKINEPVDTFNVALFALGIVNINACILWFLFSALKDIEKKPTMNETVNNKSLEYSKSEEVIVVDKKEPVKQETTLDLSSQ